MGVASFVCTYLYGPFAVIKTAVESYIHIAKNILKRVESVASALMSTLTHVIDKSLAQIVNLVKEYEKELFDMLYDSIFGSDRSFWCSKLWKCVALFSELLDSNSWLNQKLRRYLEKKCKSTATLDLMDLIHQSIDDFIVFQETVCNAGFTVEFGISYIKQLLEWCSAQVAEFTSFLKRNIKRLKLLLEDYLNTVIDWGIIDYLEKLANFFACAFDPKATSCAEIDTANNFYNEALAKLKLTKSGQGYNLSPEYRNAIYGGLEGTANYCSNIKGDIDAAFAKCIDPEKLKNANAAYNLSENIFPGGMSYSEFKRGSWKNNKVVKKFRATRDAYETAWENFRTQKTKDDDYTLNDELKNTYIDMNGDVYIKDGCDYILFNEYLEDCELTEPEEEEVVSSVPLPKGSMLWGDEIISIVEAGVRIKKNKEEDAAMVEECKALHEYVNSWKNNAGGTVRYAEATI